MATAPEHLLGVCNRHVVRSARRVIDRVDSVVHVLQLRLRAMQIRQDPVLTRELDELERDAEALRPGRFWTDDDFIAYLAELDRQHG